MKDKFKEKGKIYYYENLFSDDESKPVFEIELQEEDIVNNKLESEMTDEEWLKEFTTVYDDNSKNDESFFIAGNITALIQ